MSAPPFSIIIMIYLILNYPVRHPGISLIVGAMFVSIGPVILVIHDAIKGRTDIFVSELSDRPRLFLFACLSYVLGTLIYATMNEFLLACFASSYFMVSLAMLFISLKFKASVHTSAIAGPITYLVAVLEIEFSVLYLLLIPVYWARIKLKAHNHKELIAGIFISIIMTLINCAVWRIIL